eukprot:gene17384-20740_t
MYCLVIVLITTIVSVKLLESSYLTTDLDDNAQKGLNEPIPNFDDGIAAKFRHLRPPGRPAPPSNTRAPMTDQEQIEYHHLKAVRHKVNEDERHRLYQVVFDEVDREQKHIASMEPRDRPGYAAIPVLSNYTKLTMNDSLRLLESTWKMDPALNPFLLPKPIIFIHVPKTGGSSLGNIFKRNERRDKFHHYWVHPGLHELEDTIKLNSIFGHIRFGLHHYYHLADPNALPALDNGLNRYSYFTMLREPIDRVVSYYYYHRQNKRDPGHMIAMKYGLKEWLERSPAGNNEQARMLCGIAAPDYEGIENATANCALHHLKHTYKYVGLTEKFSESLVLLTHYAGFQAIRYTKINSGTQRVQVSDLPQDIVDEIVRRNMDDIALYNMAKEIFELQIDAIGREFFEHEVREFKKKIKVGFGGPRGKLLPQR